MKLAIKRVRFGHEGNWDKVEYRAKILSEEHKDMDIKKQWRLDSNQSLDELAIKLTILLNAFDGLELVPDESRYVSLVKSGDSYLLTQDMQVIDEEIGKLGVFVQQYIIQARGMK